MRSSLLPTLLMLLTTFCIAFVAELKADEGKKVEITGKVVALEENDKGDVISVEIATEDGKYFTVNNDEVGKGLCKLVGKTVKVTGALKTGEDGSEVLHVEKCEEVSQKPSEDPSK